MRDQHVDTDTLADLDEGLLAGDTARVVQDHLRDCARCAADRAALAGVPTLLAAAADVGPVPDDVARRLADAVRAEAVRGATATAPAGATVIPLQRRSPIGMRVLQAAAALVLVVAGLGIAVDAFQGGGDDELATSAGGAADSATDSEMEARRDVGGFPVTSSGRDWAPETVRSAVPQILAGSLQPAPTAAAGQDSGAGGESSARSLAAEATGRLAGGPELAECVTALNDGPVTPLGVDLATWQGAPAVVIVLPTPDDPATVDEWVVGPQCSQQDAQVLYFARVARP